MSMTSEPGSETSTAAPHILVSDQPVANGQITVDEVISNGPGWVAIFTIGSNGQPDQEIGHAAVQDGENLNVIVDVDPAKAQGTLEALLLVDGGEVGVFENPGPDEPLMSGVQMIASLFNVSPLASNPENASSSTQEMSPEPTTTGQTPQIILSNQPIINKTIVIPEIISVGDAWVVIHKLNGDGTMGPMAGFAHVNDGVNRNVVVPLDTNLTSTVMFAMLHQDVAKATSPQFPGVDEPVMVDGEMIAPTFEITSGETADVVVNLGNTPATGNYLVDGQQMSLYISLEDVPGKSNCTDECLATWHPLIATGRIINGTGIPKEKLGVIILPDGSRQVTYMNAPLYLYSKDVNPGDVNGQGVDGNWYLVVP